MSCITQLPAHLWPYRDSVIDAVHSGNEAPESISLIYEWLENDGWTELVDQNANGDLAVSIPNLCSEDAELRAVLDIDDAVLITNQMKIQHTRERLQELDSGSFFYDYPEITFCRIENNDGMSVVLGALFKVQQGGWDVNWVGVFKTSEQFFQAMKLNGLWTVSELDSIDDQSILQFWNN